MSGIAKTLIALVATQHLLFLVLEMFFWKAPLGLKVFRMTQEQARMSATLAANQGLYNGFLAAGLVWALCSEQSDVAIFFLTCVSLAGAFGALTVSRRIFFVQAVPALLALVLLLS